MALFRRRSSAAFPAEQQLAVLEGFGIGLSGVSLEQVLAERPQTRESVERSEFGLLAELAVDEPDGPVRTRPGVAHIGTEGAEDDDSYPYYVRVLAHAAGRLDDLADVTSSFGAEEPVAQLGYTIDGVRREQEPDVNGDWVDGMAIGYVGDDLAPAGTVCAWWIDDEGTWCTWLPKAQAKRLMDRMSRT